MLGLLGLALVVRTVSAVGVNADRAPTPIWQVALYGMIVPFLGSGCVRRATRLAHRRFSNIILVKMDYITFVSRIGRALATFGTNTDTGVGRGLCGRSANISGTMLGRMLLTDT